MYALLFKGCYPGKLKFTYVKTDSSCRFTGLCIDKVLEKAISSVLEILFVKVTDCCLWK